MSLCRNWNRSAPSPYAKDNRSNSNIYYNFKIKQTGRESDISKIYAIYCLCYDVLHINDEIVKSAIIDVPLLMLKNEEHDRF